MEIRNVAIYIRWSTEDQGEGTTLDVQLDACKAYVISQGWSFSAELVFVDDGISGATMERPALARLRALIRDGSVDCVVVYKLDRLSRSVLDMLKLVLEEWKDRCHVKSAREPIDTLTPTGRVFFYQLMSFAEWERAVIRDRMQAGRLRRAQEGRDPGIGIPYGYVKAADGSMQVDPVRGPVVQRIFRLYLSGLGARSICRALHDDGISSPAGVRWHQASVAHILGNVAYTGVLWYGKRVTRGERRVRATEPLVLREGFFPPLVARSEFEAVQRLRAERPGVGRGGGRSNPSPHLLTGLLRCGCGAAMIAAAVTKAGYKYRYYACSGAHHAGKHICSAGMLRQDELDRLVAAELLARFRGARERTLGYLQREHGLRHQEAVAALAGAEAELQRLTESERRLKGLMIDGKMSLEEYRGLAAELHGRLSSARRAAEQARRRAEASREALTAGAAHTALFDRIDEWETLDPVERKQLLRQFVQAIRAFRDKASGEFTCDITWRWGAPDGPAEAVPVLHSQHRLTEKMRAAYARRRRQRLE